MSWFALTGCTIEVADERVTQLTRAEPSERKKQAARRLALAQAYFEQSQWDAAHQEVRASLLIDSQQPRAYSLLGLIYQSEQQPQLAQRSFVAAIDLLKSSIQKTNQSQEPSSLPDVRAELALIEHNYAWLLCEQQQFSQAIELFEQVLSVTTYSERIKTQQALGLCLIRAEQPEKAHFYFESILKVQPTHALALYQLARLSYLRGEWVAAQNRMDRLHRSGQFSPESLWLAIRIHRDLQQPHAQLALSERLRQHFPASSQAQWLEQQQFDQL